MTSDFAALLRLMRPSFPSLLDEPDAPQRFFLEAVAAAPDATSLEAILDVEGVDYAASTHDSELSGADVAAIFRRVATWTDRDELARGLGLVGRLATSSAETTLAPSRALAEAKRETLAALDGLRAEISDLATAIEPDVRAGAVLLLARRPSVTQAELDALIAAIATEKSPSPLGAALLGAGRLSRALGGAGAPLGEASRPLVGHPSPLVAASASVALSLVTGEATWSVRDPAPLPASWGLFEALDRPDTTDDLGRAMLAHVASISDDMKRRFSRARRR